MGALTFLCRFAVGIVPTTSARQGDRVFKGEIWVVSPPLPIQERMS